MSMAGAERLAAVAFTRGGLEAARRLAAAVPGVQVHALRRLVPEEAGGDTRPFESADAVAAELMARATGIVFFLAAGAAVRLIAPHLRGKEIDPGVVVVDEGCRYAISLLSGHAGGGNALARRVGAALAAAPVISTATDAAHLPAPDLLGREHGWRHATAAKAVAAALLEGRPVALYQNAGEPVTRLDGWPATWPAHLRRRTALEDVTEPDAILITDRMLPEAHPGG